MSTFPQILPMANVAPPQGEQNAAGFPDEPENSSGLFEKMMTQVLSPSSDNSVVPKEQSQPPQVPVQPAEIPANFSNKMPRHNGTPMNVTGILSPAIHSNSLVQPKTATLNPGDSDATTPTGGAPSKNKNSQTPVETITVAANLETFLNQIFTVPVLAVNPMGKSGGEKASGGSAAPSLTGAPELNAVPLAPTRTNPVSTATTKVPLPELSGSQMTPTIQTVTAQQANASVAKETALPAKDTELTTPPQTNPAAAMAVKSSEPKLAESQTAVGLTNSGSAFELGNTIARVSDSSAGTVAQPQPEANGTSIAKQDIAMKQAEKTNKIAGQTEKVLPGNIVSASQGNFPSGISLNTESITATATAASSALGNVNGTSPPPSDSVAVSATADARASTLERTQDLVTVSAMRLSDVGNSSMQVVIKPDAGTQLSLELRQQGGNVEVQAVLQQGDFNHLNQQWPDLQQRLEERGIRLAPLTDEGAAGGSNSGNETFQNKQNQANEVVPELTLVNAPAGMFAPEPAQTSACQGWETWA
jgi:hypothetical protein